MGWKSSGNSIMDLVDAEQDRKAKLRAKWEKEEEDKSEEVDDVPEIHESRDTGSVKGDN